MVYQKSWNESAPSGQLPADQIDTAIQDDKIATRERLEQVIPGFSIDTVDPKRVRAVLIGTKADRPEGQLFDGIIYLATDEDKVYYTTESGAWAPWPQAAGLTLAKGLEADLPSPAETTFYIATDSAKLYYNDGADPPEYVEIAGGGGAPPDPTNVAEIKRVIYTGTNAVGGKMTGLTDLTRMITVFGVATTDSDSVFQVDLRELSLILPTPPDPVYLVDNLLGYHINRFYKGAWGLGQHLISIFPIGATNGDNSDVGENVLYFRVVQYLYGGNPQQYQIQSVPFTLTLYFSA
jgi:hypothetical protein